jgi:class 3 adenylate cyclase
MSSEQVESRPAVSNDRATNGRRQLVGRGVMSVQPAWMTSVEAVKAFRPTRSGRTPWAGATVMDHRLVACLHADVSGYSCLITGDVEATARQLTTYQHLIGNVAAAHGGRVIDTSGDSLFAAFPTVPAAVRCAIEVQRQLRASNAELPPGRRIEFRVGIEFGEVVVDDGRVYGHCVNVAARVQEIAAPGRICLTESAFDRASPLMLPCEDLGERAVKNIDEPIRVYQIVAGCGP